MGAHPREQKLSEQELNQDTTTDTNIDIQRLKRMLFTWFTIPHDTDQHDAPLLLSLKEAGITKWSDFVIASLNQVGSLTCRHQETTDAIPLPISQHLTKPFCPSSRSSVNAQVATWQDATHDSTSPSTSSVVCRAHSAPQSCILILLKKRIRKSTPDRNYLLSAVSHTYNHCINRVSYERQLQENKSTPKFCQPNTGPPGNLSQDLW
jgi:hypothetical protein